MCKFVCAYLVPLGFYCYGVSGLLILALGGDTARRLRDVTAKVVLAVLGAGDRCWVVRLGVVPCARGRGLSWGGNAAASIKCGFCQGPKF